VQLDTTANLSLTSMLVICQSFACLPLDLADASIAKAAERLQIPCIVLIDKAMDV
jgi:hypothetical protein